MQRAADDVFRDFARKINTGVLREGDTLPTEREIVEIYGVSRTVAREAVLALANKGLIEAKPRHRPVVRKPSYESAFEAVSDVVARLLMEPDGIRNLFDTRIMIEVSLARQAAQDADENDIAALQNFLDKNEAAIEDSELFYQTDISFHAAIYRISRNPIMPAIQNAYTSWLEPQWSKMQRLPDRNRTNYEAHKAIFEAIKMGDQDGAEAATRSHLDAAWRQLRESFSDL